MCIGSLHIKMPFFTSWFSGEVIAFTRVSGLDQSQVAVLHLFFAVFDQFTGKENFEIDQVPRIPALQQHHPHCTKRSDP